MSFVVGYVTGEVVERRKGRNQFRDYMERHGYTIVDRAGRPVPLDTVIEEVLRPQPQLGKTVLAAGIVVAAAVLISGGSALAVLAVT